MEETKRRRFIIRAVLEGEVDIGEAPGPAPIDWDKDPLEGIEWMDNKSYSVSTGVLENAANEHCTTKFSVQQCTYYLKKTAGSYLAIFAWDENDQYLGRIQHDGLYQLDSRYKYALKINQPSSFDPSTVSLMPKNNEDTAAERIEINLNDNIGSFSVVSGSFELNVGTALSAQGITSGNMKDKIKSANHMALLETGNRVYFANYSPVRFCFYNVSTLQFQIAGVAANTAALEAYLADHDVSIILNGD